MLTHPLLTKLTQLKYHGMKIALQEQLGQEEINSLSFEDRLMLLLDREITQRNQLRLQLRLKQAKLKQTACLENIDFKASRGLDKSQLLSLGSCQWIREHHNVLLVGATGTGKTFIGCALAHRACLEGFSAAYLRLPRLFQELQVAKGDGRYTRFIQQLAKIDVLILDDWGLSPFTEEQCRDLLEIVDDRHKLRSTIVTSQFPIKHWHEILNNPTLADAILDRLVHNAYKLQLKGESLRKKSPTVEEKLAITEVISE